MGGHGGLNILPQKRWNVYNYENREKVRRDEEAAAKEEQLKQEQARKRDAELRLERLRVARGLAPAARKSPEPVGSGSNSNSNHINLFEGIKIFDPIKGPENGRPAEEEREEEGNKTKKMKVKKEEVRVVTAEDEKYRLGYGVAGRGVKLPWYLERRRNDDRYVNEERGENEGLLRGKKEVKEEGKKIGKKSLQELREERLKREKKEKERERALLGEKSRIDGGFSRRR